MNPQNKTLALPALAETNALQIDTALKVTMHLASVLRTNKGGEDNWQGSNAWTSELPEQARISAETTFINACNTLDKMLDSAKRWQLNEESSADALALQIRVNEQRLAQEQILAVQAHQLPHVTLRPVVDEVVPGVWACVYGGCIGQGSSPAEAAADFDLRWITGEYPKAEPRKSVRKPTTKRKKS